MKFKIWNRVKKNPKVSDFIDFVRKKENRKTIALVGTATILLLVIQIVKGDTFNGKYIEDKAGNIIGISRETLEEGVSVPIQYKAGNESDEIQLYLGGKEQETSNADIVQSQEELLKEQMDKVIRSIEDSQTKVVMLPKALDDGSKITWNKPEQKADWILLGMFPLIVVLMYKSSVDKAKTMAKERVNGIKRTLPTFNNQLLLLLNSGLIFNDAFGRIAMGYKRRNPDDKKPLEKNIVKIYEKSTDTNSSLISLLNQYSKTVEVKEFSRLVTIISDNQYKGVDLKEKLEVESGILWEQRKKTAEEKGKLAETKLTFPLAILLLVLIIITAAPAILQI